jgi:putative transcriptional regulator
MINYHPTDKQLQQFAEGNISSALALVVSAHCDVCSQCQEKVDDINIELSSVIENIRAHDYVDPAFEKMLASIMHLPIVDTKPVVAPRIELDGRFFDVPRPLQRFVKNTGNWSHLLGKVWQAPVDLGDAGMANFIYMEKGGRVPEHTHKGTELTLVVDGEFSDGLADYDSGDFIIMDNEHIHSPHSNAVEGCLVFSIVDKPLHFTSGIARLLNPFSHLFFK